MKRSAKVTLHIFAPDMSVHRLKASMDNGGFCTVDIKGVKYSYLVPIDDYEKGQRDFFYRLDDVHPFDLMAATQMPAKAVAPMAAFLNTFRQVSVSRDRMGRLEMLRKFTDIYRSTTVFTVQGFGPTDPDNVVIKMPEAGFMYEGSLNDLAKAIEAVEKIDSEKVDSDK